MSATLKNISVGAFVITAVIASGALSGCGSGRDRNSATAKATANVSDDATEAKQELDHVVGALKGIRDASDTADLKRLYSDLKSHTGDLEDNLEDVISSSENAVAAGKNQINKWHEQANTFTDSDLRNASNKRESDLRTDVDALSASTAKLKAASQAYQQKLSQTLTALDLDLTQKGVQSIKPVIAKLIDEEAPLREAISDVSAKSQSVNGRITP